jgi:hypothetical protein
MKRPNKALQPTFSLRENAAELKRSAAILNNHSRG